MLSGLVQITAEDYYGNRSIMSKAGAGELFGEVFACAGIAEAPVSVFAAERTQIMFLNCGLLLQESAAGGCDGRELETERLQQVLTRNLLRIVAQKALFLNRKIEFLSGARRAKSCWLIFRRRRVRPAAASLLSLSTDRSWPIFYVWSAVPCPQSLAA